MWDTSEEVFNSSTESFTGYTEFTSGTDPFDLTAGSMTIDSTDGIAIDANNFFKQDGTFSFGSGLLSGSSSSVTLSGSNAVIDVTTFDLDASTLTISSQNSGSIALGATPPTAYNTGSGIYFNGSGDALIGDSSGNKLSFNGSTLDIQSDSFNLDAGTIYINNSNNGVLALDSSDASVASFTTGTGIYADGTGSVRLGDTSSYLRFNTSDGLKIKIGDETDLGASVAELRQDIIDIYLGNESTFAGIQFLAGQITLKVADDGKVASARLDATGDESAITLRADFFDFQSDDIVLVGDPDQDGGTEARVALGVSASSITVDGNEAGFIANGSGEFKAYLDSNNYTRLTTSSFDIRSENLVAKGNTVEISGSNFHLLNGNITASNVDLSGNISATTGNIGGFTITDSAITGSGFYLSGSAINDEFFISASNFNVKANGQLTASAALIGGTSKIAGFTVSSTQINDSGNNLLLKSSGEITASAGLIGGWEIDSTSLSKLTPGVGDGIKIDSSNNLITVSSDSPAEVVRIGELRSSVYGIEAKDWSGNTKIFHVEADGSTVSGSIAGFQFSTTQINDSSGTNLVLKSNGQITASAAQISGDITANTGKLFNLDVSGSLNIGTGGTLTNGNVTINETEIKLGTRDTSKYGTLTDSGSALLIGDDTGGYKGMLYAESSFFATTGIYLDTLDASGNMSGKLNLRSPQIQLSSSVETYIDTPAFTVTGDITGSNAKLSGDITGSNADFSGTVTAGGSSVARWRGAGSTAPSGLTDGDIWADDDFNPPRVYIRFDGIDVRLA